MRVDIGETTLRNPANPQETAQRKVMVFNEGPLTAQALLTDEEAIALGVQLLPEEIQAAVANVIAQMAAESDSGIVLPPGVGKLATPSNGTPGAPE